MLRSRIKIGDGWGRGFSFGVLVLALHSTPVLAGIEAISGGVSIPTPLGFNYDTLSSSVGGQVDLFMDPPWSSRMMLLQFSVNYEGFGLRNAVSTAVGTTTSVINSITMPTATFFAGVMFMGGHTYTKGFTPFVTGQVGGALTTLLLTGNVAAVTNLALSPAAQVSPGFDLPLFQGIGLQAQMPYRFIFSRTMLSVLDVVVSVRIKL